MKELNVLPSISFIIPTYNAAAHLSCCLQSIRSQDYPPEKVEILVVDGGSGDATLDLAKEYGCKIISNPKRLAEYGVQLGVQYAVGSLVTVFAADNELVGRDWMSKVVDVFMRFPHVCALWGRLVSGARDSALNKYFELLQSDPLNWFLNNNIEWYEKQASRYKTGWFLFDVKPSKPLVWGANGLVYQRQIIQPIWRQEGYLGDNDAFQYMVEQGNSTVAYFDAPFVYHHHVVSLSQWVKKWERNFRYHLVDKYKTRNMNWVFTKSFKTKLLCWVVYSAIPLFSLLHSIYLSFRDKNWHWFYHPIVSFLQFFTYLKVLLIDKNSVSFVMRDAFGV